MGRGAYASRVGLSVSRRKQRARRGATGAPFVCLWQIGGSFMPHIITGLFLSSLRLGGTGGSGGLPVVAVASLLSPPANLSQASGLKPFRSGLSPDISCVPCARVPAGSMVVRRCLAKRWSLSFRAPGRGREISRWWSEARAQPPVRRRRTERPGRGARIVREPDALLPQIVLVVCHEALFQHRDILLLEGFGLVMFLLVKHIVSHGLKL